MHADASMLVSVTQYIIIRWQQK